MEKSLFGLEGKRFIVLGGGLGMGEATTRAPKARSEKSSKRFGT